MTDVILTRQSIAARFNQEVALLSPAAVDNLSALMQHAPLAADETPYEELCAAAFGFQASEQKKLFTYSGGIAFIPIQGTLLHRYAYSGEYATGYDAIRTRLTAAMADPEVKGIVLDVNSPGGQVAGNFELADMIREARDQKPIMALVDAIAMSGGYSLASAASKIVATQSAMVGSIGVVVMHVDYSKMLKDSGINVTYVYAGDQKVEGSPYLPLSADAKARIQDRVNSSYDKFVTLVANNRGIDSQAVRDTEAGMFSAEDAKSLRLVDAVQSPYEALATFRNELSGSNSIANRSETMTEATKPGAENASTAPAAEAASAVVKTERERIAGILNCEEAKGRSALANHIALNTGLSIDDAKAMLAVAPAEAAAAPAAVQANHTDAAAAFQEAMSKDNPGVGAGSDAASSKAEPDAADRIIASYAMATGRPIPKTH